MGEARWGLSLAQVGTRFDALVERAETAAAVGFDSVWLTDHLIVPDHPDADLLEALTTAAAVAARTSEVRIGHLVLNAALRHPVLLAKSLATVDVISGGRLEIGLGWGSLAEETRRLGVSAQAAAERADALADLLTVLPPLLRGETVSFTGRWFRLDEVRCRPATVQQLPPLHLAGVGPRRTLPLVRAHADWWNIPATHNDRVAELRPLAPDVRLSVQHLVGVVNGRRTAEGLEGFARRRLAAWGPPTVGTPGELVQRFAEQREAGAEMFVVHLIDDSLDALVEFGRDVVGAS
jgi:alkanesulfonate monooxygenase SsuD/methylene tetrahydromethanopterin reductase-like flavin-dependent oxidoreductase (luciferase family)